MEGARSEIGWRATPRPSARAPGAGDARAATWIAVAATTLGVGAAACAIEVIANGIEGGKPPLWTPLALLLVLTAVISRAATRLDCDRTVARLAVRWGAAAVGLRAMASVIRVPPRLPYASTFHLVPVLVMAGLLGVAVGAAIGFACARVIEQAVEARRRRSPAALERVLWSAGVWLTLIGLACFWPLAGAMRAVTAIVAVSAVAALAGAVCLERGRLAWVEAVRRGKVAGFRVAPGGADDSGEDAPLPSFFASAPLMDSPDDEVLEELAAPDGDDYRVSAAARSVAVIPADAAERVADRTRRAAVLGAVAQVAAGLALAFPSGPSLRVARPPAVYFQGRSDFRAQSASRMPVNCQRAEAGKKFR